MEHMENNKNNFEKEDPEIIDKELYELHHELESWEIKNQVSQMFLEEQKLYLQDLQKLIAENNKDNSSEEDELEETVLSMQKTVEKLYEEYFSLSENSDARDNLVSLVQSVESSAHIRGLEFEKHRKSFEQIREKQENSEELKELNKMQAILDAETEKFNVLLVEKEQLDKQVAEKEAQDMKELQKMIIELAAFAVKALKHEEQERDENLLIEKLEKKLSILEVKDKAIVDNEEDYLSDNAMVIQVELCQDKIPQFESIFKDPNDFPFLSSLKKTEDDKVVDKSFDLPDKNADEKLMKNNKKRVRKAEQLPSSSSKDSSEILEISKKSSPIESKSPITPVFKSPMISKVASRKQEVSIIDRLPPKKSRKRSIVLDVNDSKPIEDGMQNVESVQESPKRSVVLDSETPCTRVSLDYPVTTRNSIINSSPKVSVDSPVTSKITRQSPTNQANIISVEILPKVGPKLRSQPNLSDTKPRLLSREIIDKSVEESSESILMNVDDDKKTSQETEVIVVSPKEIIWKSPQQKKPLVDKNQTESDSCSEISDNDNLFDDYETSSIKSGNGSEFNFLSPNSDRSFKMNTSENDDAKENKKNAFDFDSFSDSGNFAGGSLF